MPGAKNYTALPEPYLTQSLAHRSAILNAPNRHRLFEALDRGLNYLRELSTLEILSADETVKFGRLWGDYADQRLRSLPELGAPGSIRVLSKEKPDPVPDPLTQAAIEHLLALAERDLEQSRKVANFLLAWWNAAENGGFDFADLCGMNQESASACSVIFNYSTRHGAIPLNLGYEPRFKALALKWRAPI